jgi:mannose-6-phosphate isomerase-like protein (cupin superfamily)
MAPPIIKTSNRDEFLTRERCFVRELTNTPDVAKFSLAEARVEPGVTTELHRLDVDEWYVITGGGGTVEVGEDPPTPVGPGDIVVIPAGTPQRIHNDGDADLVFLCLCLPRFRPDGYEPLE